MFDKIAVATEAARILGLLAENPKHSAGSILDALYTIFPWLGEFNITRDGNDYRWLAINGYDPDKNIVFTTRQQAMIQVRDWILQYCEENL